MPPRLPEKIYFKIGEVSEIVGVEPYVLRYWETEFDLLKPSKAPSKHRLYKKRDVELLLEIKRLLYTEGFTIEGARKKLKEAKKEEKDQLKLPLSEQKYQKRSGETQKRFRVAAQITFLNMVAPSRPVPILHLRRSFKGSPDPYKLI